MARRADAAGPAVPAEDRRADGRRPRSPRRSTRSTSTRSSTSRPRQLELNEIGVCNLELDQRDRLRPLRARTATLGGFILIDRMTNDTVGAGHAALRAAPRRRTSTGRRSTSTSARARRSRARSRACCGSPACPGAGKSTIANLVEKKLHALGRHTYLLDGDNVRHGLNKDLGFTDADRVENIRRVAEVAKLMVDAGLIVLVVVHLAVPRRAAHGARAGAADGEFIEVFVDTPLAVAEQRDPKGLYKKARARRAARTSPASIRPTSRPSTGDHDLRAPTCSSEQAAEHIVEELQRRGMDTCIPPNDLSGLHEASVGQRRELIEQLVPLAPCGWRRHARSVCSRFAVMARRIRHR